MASKFQNRLVGTVIIVALGVIILPGLLDGKKKHYKEEFAAIPLVPKPGDQQDSDMVPPVTQPLPAQPPEGAGAAVDSSNGQNDEASSAAQGKTAPAQPSAPAVIAPPPLHNAAPQQQPVQKPAEKPKPQPAKPQPPVEKPKPVEPPKAEAPKPEPVKPAEKAPVQPESAPAGQAWMVQLGALKNAAKVNEVVAKLRLSGYRAFTVPATPVQGQITRIYVGPDVSKAKMQAAVSDLKGISGLGGVVKPYSAR